MSIILYNLLGFLSSLLSSDIIILFLGSVLGGISTTLMFSVFESWMVTEYNRKFPEEAPATLSGIFSIMTTLNTAVAISAGIVAEFVTNLTGTEKAPFMTAIGMLLHYFHLEMPSQSDKKSTLQLFLSDKRLLALGLTSAIFEGSMYIFIFFKFAALKLSHSLAVPSSTGADLPFGLVFAILMCSMMLGSMIYNRIHTLIAPKMLLIHTLAVAAASFFVPVLWRDERVTFWCFCVFEVCCGIYFPLMASQKVRVVEDGVRANVYGLIRIPLNVFVVVVLGTTREGARHRDFVFTLCSALMLGAVAANGMLL